MLDNELFSGNGTYYQTQFREFYRNKRSEFSQTLHNDNSNNESLRA